MKNLKALAVRTFQSGKNKAAAVGAAVMVAAGSAHAAVPASVTTSFTDLAADTLTVAGLALGIYLGIKGFKYFRSAT